MIRLACALLVTACAADDGGPRLTSVMPSAAAHNSMVTLTGSRLCGAGDCMHVAATVQLGLEPPMIDAAIAAYSTTSATIVVPSSASVGSTSLIVTVDGRSSNAVAFEVTP